MALEALYKESKYPSHGVIKDFAEQPRRGHRQIRLQPRGDIDE